MAYALETSLEKLSAVLVDSGRDRRSLETSPHNKPVTSLAARLAASGYTAYLPVIVVSSHLTRK
eukprot:5343110-Prymnesium_polylepis.1